MSPVKLYSTQDCYYCDKVKRFLVKHKIEFVEVDVANDREAAIELVERSGQLGVPALDVDGKILIGYDKEAMRAALGIVEKGPRRDSSETTADEDR